MPYEQIPSKLDWTVSSDTLRKALQKEGFNRRIARLKPALSDANKLQRLKWAQEHVHWSRQQWDSILWTDESMFHARNTYRTWVTRRPGEEFREDCVAAKARGGNSWMIWGCFSGAAGLGPLLIWDKDWGKVNSETYCQHTLPLIEGWLKTHPGHLFMQDNAAMHYSKYTREEMNHRGIHPIFWPPNSPDLNPIEKFWKVMKRRLYERVPIVTAKWELQDAIKEEWGKIKQEFMDELIEDMRERCWAVIEAEGGPTRF
jgi:ketohexokinase/beta-glucosidase